MNLSQQQVADIIGTDVSAISKWELGIKKPSNHYRVKIIAFLGYSPFHSVAKAMGERIRLYCFVHGLTQKKFGALVGVKDPKTVAGWEKETTLPRPEVLQRILKVLDGEYL